MACKEFYLELRAAFPVQVGGDRVKISNASDGVKMGAASKLQLYSPASCLECGEGEHAVFSNYILVDIIYKAICP